MMLSDNMHELLSPAITTFVIYSVYKYIMFYPVMNFHVISCRNPKGMHYYSTSLYLFCTVMSIFNLYNYEMIMRMVFSVVKCELSFSSCVTRLCWCVLLLALIVFRKLPQDLCNLTNIVYNHLVHLYVWVHASVVYASLYSSTRFHQIKHSNIKSASLSNHFHF